RERVQLVTRRMPSFSTTDRDDLVQEFMMRCLTKHLSRWEPSQSSLSGFLYRRLHGDVVDALRRRITADKRGRGDVDPDTLIDHEHGHDDIAARRHRERALAALDAAVVKLPRRQRAVVRRTLNGESATDVASSLRVHASTVSRERSAAIVALRAVVEAA
ncbi:MAG TPA: sigma-70 family RNA polymerase sigma factor, partial [Myxococcota bacterium]